MPTYSFHCPACEFDFELFAYMADYDVTKAKLVCPECLNPYVVRDFEADSPRTTIRLSNDQIKLGHLAARNGERMSNDEKAHLNYKHNEYKYKEVEKDLPKGMSRMGPPGQRKIDTRQHKANPRKSNRGK